jgi:UDP-GlcNAc:undecaprenyl-phosphate GlcNAc-1-phosphate transferase
MDVEEGSFSTMSMNDAAWFLPLALVLTAALCLALIPLARRIGLVDHPGARKVHEAVTPLTGGPALLLVLVALGAWWLPGDRFMQALLAGGLLIFVVGLLDDLRDLSAAPRFLVQIAACLVVMVWADVRLDDFGRLFWNDVLELGWLGAAITVFAALGVINSFNLIDGMDGLAGGIFLVAAAGMALFAGLAGQTELFQLLLLAMAAVAGFLLLNARSPWNVRARIFLGDSGSMLLGFLLAWCFIALGNDRAYTAGRAFMPMTAVWLFAVPLLDTTTQIWRRWRAGLPVFGADQHHLHHAFLRAGYTTGETWSNITLLALAAGGVGVLLEVSAAPDYLSFWLFIAVAFGYKLYMQRTWNQQRFLGRHFIYNEFDPTEP